MRNLDGMNDLYNMQDVILLCEIIENRFEKMHKKFGYNPRKCNSASTLSGCVQRNQSKVIITLPTNYEHAEIFENTLIGGYTCVNNRIGFNTEVLLPNFSKSEYAKMSIGESFKAYKNQKYKVGFTIKLDNDEKSKEYRVISKKSNLMKTRQGKKQEIKLSQTFVNCLIMLILGMIVEIILIIANFSLLMTKLTN